MPKLSYEALVGTVIALIVVILDQAGVKNPYVLWIAFALALGLCLDAAMRSQWSARRKWWGSVVILLCYGVFAGYLMRQSHTRVNPGPLAQQSVEKKPESPNPVSPPLPKSERPKTPKKQEPTSSITKPNGTVDPISDRELCSELSTQIESLDRIGQTYWNDYMRLRSIPVGNMEEQTRQNIERPAAMAQLEKDFVAYNGVYMLKADYLRGVLEARTKPTPFLFFRPAIEKSELSSHTFAHITEGMKTETKDYCLNK